MYNQIGLLFLKTRKISKNPLLSSEDKTVLNILSWVFQVTLMWFDDILDNYERVIFHTGKNLE